MARVYSRKELESRKIRREVKGQNRTGEQYCRQPGQTVTIDVPLEIIEGFASPHANMEYSAIQLGVLVMKKMIDDEIEGMVGRWHAHNPDRAFVRHGREKSAYVVIGGKKVPVERPRVRTVGGEAEVPLEKYRAFQRDGQLEREALNKMVIGVSTRKYERAVEEFCEGYGISRSSISRRLKVATAAELKELLERDLNRLDLVAIVLDGIHFGGHAVIVGLGVNLDGKKHVLGLWEGASENATVVGELLDDLIARGLSAEKDYLFLIDGSKALRKGIKTRFGEGAATQRCQKHKLENVKEHLPKKYHWAVVRRLRVAYGMAKYEEAKAELEKTAEWLEGISGSAAASLREGMEETLTVTRLELPETLRVSLRTTNMIESCFSGVRVVTGKVKRWRSGGQAARWAAAGLLESERRFKRVKGYESMSVLKAKLEEHKKRREKSEKEIDRTKEVA